MGLRSGRHVHNLTPPAGMDREVGLLFAQLEFVRRDTREALSGLSTETLDGLPPGAPSTIGELAWHIADVEEYWIRKVVLADLPFDTAAHDSEPARTGAAHPLRGRSIDFYLARLDEVRAHTESACWKLGADVLDDPCRTLPDGEVVTPRWAFAHLVEHEAHHRGQIKLMKRLTRGAS